ncbi:MAG: signal peptide peptidase SppA [Ignavibacteriae bacterium]|nr:signal peptide peptidase SppA [Ignavibacteriota bacterium]
MSNTGKWILGIGLALLGLGMLAVAFGFFGLITTLSTSQSGVYDETVGSSSGSGTVAVIDLEEPILESEEIVRQFRKYQNRNSVKAIVLRLNSPGGAVAPSQEIFQEVKRTRDLGKPVVVSMGSIAASGAYYIAAGASRIVANPGTITGSIGVISEFTSFKGLMDKLGIENTTVKSGKYKDVGNPSRQMNEVDIAQIQALIDDVYDQFVEDVATARGLDRDSVRILAEGRIYTGRQAYRNGLVDTIGTFQTAVTIAGVLGGIVGEPHITRERRRESFIERMMGSRAVSLMDDMQKRLRTSAPLEYRMSYSQQ